MYLAYTAETASNVRTLSFIRLLFIEAKKPLPLAKNVLDIGLRAHRTFAVSQASMEYGRIE